MDTDISLRSEPAWATVILESITPIGTIEREYYPEYHFSVAEIKILEFHYYGKDLKDVAKKGDTIKIIVPYIIDNDEVIMSYGSYYSLDRKETHIFPMTEVGKKYVVSIYERADSETLYRMSGTNQRYCEFAEVAEIWEGYIKDNCPELSGVNLDLLSSYPMFSMDVSETMNLNAYRFDPGWVQMYVAIYDRYMKGNISESAPETQFYELYNRNVYNYYAMTLQRTP